MGTATEENSNQFNLRINERDLSKHYSDSNYSALLKVATDWLNKVSKLHLPAINRSSQAALDFSAELIGHYFTRPNLNFTQKDFVQLLRLHQPLSNLFALSSYKNTDFWLKTTNFSSNSELIFLPLLTARNEISFSRKSLFDKNPTLASEWYGQYLFGVRSFASEVVSNNLKKHLGFWDSRMTLCVSLSNGYMRSTYIDPNLDRHYKYRFNNLVKTRMGNLKIRNRPKKKNIAVVTARWATVHPTYKNRFELFKELGKHFDLTLVHIGPERKDIEGSIFKKLINARFQNGMIHAPELFDNEFGMVFYPDIGMNVESRFLSNLRLAPIQVTTNSHPVSTFGSEIDFFLTGEESEEASALAHRHYSERLVLIPGIGTMPDMPRAKPPAIRESQDTSREKANASTLIACPWGSLKINNDLLKSLRRISERSTKHVRFRLLCTLGLDALHYASTLSDIQNVLGVGNVELFADLPYPNYMEKLEECAFALDAFPFGGNTSIVDCIYLRKPIVSRLGWQFYNRAGPVILRYAGFDELVTDTEDGFIALASELVNNPTNLAKLQNRLSQVDVAAVLQSLTSKDAFVEACKYLIYESPDPNIRTPIVIK